MAMADIQAFLVITLLTWAAVSVSETTPELSTMTGETVNIPCLFEGGTIRNLFWYYNNGTERHNILSLAKGQITLGAEYADRASLQDDNSTLILEDITVTDEVTYRCDVDRLKQTPVLNINTKLNVFSLRPDTLPVISPNYTWAVDASSCSIRDNQSFNLTCTLPNVYPVQDTELIWYQDGKRVSSTPDVTQNDDGTTDIVRQIQVSETGNFRCNATYLSVNGKENTAVSVEACIIPPKDAPNTSGKNLMIGLIAGILTSIVLLVPLVILNSREADGNPPNPQSRNDDPQLVQVTTEVTELLDISPETGSEIRNGDGDPPTTLNSNDDDSQHDQGKLLGTQQETATEPGASSASSTSRKEVTDMEINNLSKKIPDGKYSELFVILGFEYNYISTKKNTFTDPTAAAEVLLQEWKNKGESMEELDAALIKAELGGLVPEYKNKS